MTSAALAVLVVPPHRRWLVAGLCSGALFVVVFGLFGPVSTDAYSYRDDAVITLSHARNLVDYGSIGVDAAGARVEGFSTPLQFAVFVVVYALTHCGYRLFLDCQVYVCTFLLGWAVLEIFRPRLRWALPLSVAVSLALSSAVRFYGWHRSGMENPYGHLLLVATVAAMVRSLEVRAVSRWVVAFAFLASLVRTESVLHVAPLLVIYCLAYRKDTGRNDALRTSAWALSLWALVQLGRYSYFGDLRPNTALGEGIVIAAPLKAILTGGPAPRAALDALDRIARDHRAYLVLLGLPLCAFGARSTRRRLLVMLLSSLCLTGLLHPLLFGPARLDPVRTTSHVALIAPLLVASQWAELSRWRARAAASLLLAGSIALYVHFEPPADKGFCCAIDRATPIAEACLAHAAAENLHRPSLANPDLGKMSYRKSFLLFDLGLLASPPLAALHGDRAATADYFLDLAQPDFIEMHGAWSCEYGYLQADPRFRARYRPVPEARTLGLGSSCPPAQAGLWFRTAMERSSGTSERALMDSLEANLDLARIEAELTACRQQAGPLACAYVARTVYRFIPELVRLGELERAAALFAGSPSAPYDTSILRARSEGAWYRPVLSFVRAIGAASQAVRAPAVSE